ncbi:MAG: hypothetical protein CO113_02220 [Elusimicrobia bacterium CG_4_9_14_3_um_filter_62_55]|nr:MAG: hypothetical protein COR54_03895 [Elusimicrobia bacterium CG22_combo_CG10-13_8_21_14_all_63_91]PJA18512.1 MAG: hypothetical protein COX66_00870 [Elusimicrobia bacterium CG_4_10_14_0_2_um_filter_63_34]PJB26689.1 MAG: hypothetical protein CO113_02220 [Elusimicrobia bacterium CG_4_9_14_3_um_filter_62_55]
MPLPPSVFISLDRTSETVLQTWRKDSPGRRGLRAEIILRAATGHHNLTIARNLGISRNTVKLWRRRFAQEGLDGLKSRPIPGRPRKHARTP